MITTLYQSNGDNRREFCFCVETSAPLTETEMQLLHGLLAETSQPELTRTNSFLSGGVMQVGPRPAVETAASSNAVAICRSLGINKVTRIETLRRYLLPMEGPFDRMTECVYNVIPESFTNNTTPEPVSIIPLIEDGPKALQVINRDWGLGMDDFDIEFNYDLFANVFKRNPTIVECFGLANANSEHSRHWFFKGKMIIDGIPMPRSLMQLVKESLRLLGQHSNSVIAFADNSSAIQGREIKVLVPAQVGPRAFSLRHRLYDIIFTAETHNHPTMVEEFRGAETGTGGRIRDIQATGRGGLVVAGTAGYCVGNLLIPGFSISGENLDFKYPEKYRRPLQILIGASNGASDYGNKFGEPLINGFVRSFGLSLPNGERREWIKPIMFTGGIGQMERSHVKKRNPQKGMFIIQIGGPAYRIGLGGGAASSMTQGQNTENLDFNSVQRGNAEMGQKVNRVVRACVELREKNPILSIHDQGAGGPCNVLTELVHPAGGKVNIRAINVGDTSMSVLEIWGAEYQERLAILLKPEDLEMFQEICAREVVPCEVLGEVTGDGNITVYDSNDGTTPVNLVLDKILGSVPQKTFRSDYPNMKLQPLAIPSEESVGELLKKVLRLPSVGSKGYLIRKVDRSVTGLVAQQQCCGPLHLPVSDFAVCAQSHSDLFGMATANGEQPIKMLVNAGAGARMAIGEMLTNIVWVKSEGLVTIKSSGNWMWPAKLPGEGALIYDAAAAASDLLVALGGAEIDGGKDSLSMAASFDGETVKAPGQFVVSGYVAVPDITKKVTPDLKKWGKSKLALIDISAGQSRLGGSALAQAFGQIGNESPDVDGPIRLRRGFEAVQEMIDQGLILSGHDRSDGGLIVALVEMALAGNIGIDVILKGQYDEVARLFAEELGLLIEYLPEKEEEILSVLDKHFQHLPLDECFHELGSTTVDSRVKIGFDGLDSTDVVLNEDLETIRSWWEATSDKLEEFQMNPECAKAAASARRQHVPCSHLSFTPSTTPKEWMKRDGRPRVAIVREEGSNGDREMAAAFYAAGFEPCDVPMADLLKGKINLNDPRVGFRGVAFVGGFSYADVFGSAKGWAAIIRSNERLKEMFETFKRRSDTFSLGVCNGCQLMAILGWVPGIVEDERDQLRFVHNTSGRFESNWLRVRIEKSPAIMLREMEGSVLGVWVAHGEGRLFAPKEEILLDVIERRLAPMVYVDQGEISTESYPLNPNGSPRGITSLCSPCGRHLAMMPHPERSFLKWQWPWLPKEVAEAEVSPWLRLFQNAREWCELREV